MKQFNVDVFLSDILELKSAPASLMPPSIATDITIEASDSSIVSSSKAFLNVVFDYLKAKHGLSAAYEYSSDYQVRCFNSLTGTGSDHIVMNEHGFMDNPPAPGITPLEDAVEAVNPATNDCLYITDEVLV